MSSKRHSTPAGARCRDASASIRVITALTSRRPPGRTVALLVLATVLWTASLPGQEFDLEGRRDTHWAWQALTSPTPPVAAVVADDDPAIDAAAVDPAAVDPAAVDPAAVDPAAVDPAAVDPADAIDAFIRRRLAGAGLQPAPPAPPHAALRRLWLDLIGLPPDPATVREFLRDPSAAAWDRQIDGLLASPHFGERWGRHWLDLVRFAETLGHEYDFPIANAWRYRDYVIRALNADLPYDEFLREHLAGDLLPDPRRNAAGENESVQATAAWWFVEQTHSPVDAAKHTADRIDNQIDVLGKAMLGMTVACARCHDHKFDAISQADYYSLFGFVKSSRYVQAPIAPAARDGEAFRRVRAAQRELARTWAAAAAPVGGRWDALGRTDPARWDAGGGSGPLRAGDRVIATAERPERGWIHTNDAFGAAPWRGPWCPDPTNDAAELDLLPGAFWHSGIGGRRREGTLQTRTFTVEEPWLHVRVAGRDSRVLVIVDGFHIVRNPIYGGLSKRVGKASPHWLTFDVAAWRGRPAYVQCIDQVAHDLGDAHRRREDDWPQDGWLAVQSVIASTDRSPPDARGGLTLPYRPWEHEPAAVTRARTALAEAQAAMPAPSPTLPALGDGTGMDERLFIRGDHRTPGELQPRRFLTALAGDDAMAIERGSGRLELAAAILAPDNPLPPRTLVNRLWHHLFGRGLSRSVDNLGVLGDPPTHPQLLDWLASDFVAGGWSIKRSIRAIVRSDTYRQSSATTSAGQRADPGNLLLHRQNVRRLEAEAVRDTLLAVSGSFDPKLYGASVPIPHDQITNARGKPRDDGPVDGHGRRSIYLAIRRNFMPPMLNAFDLPTPFATVGRRSVSNVPAQALTLLNDPFVHEMCRRWADRLLTEHAADAPAERIRTAWLAAFGRAARTTEVARCLDFLRAAAAEHTSTVADAPPWTDLLHCLVNTKEFTFRR